MGLLAKSALCAPIFLVIFIWTFIKASTDQHKFIDDIELNLKQKHMFHLIYFCWFFDHICIKSFLIRQLFYQSLFIDLSFHLYLRRNAPLPTSLMLINSIRKCQKGCTNLLSKLKLHILWIRFQKFYSKKWSLFLDVWCTLSSRNIGSIISSGSEAAIY